MTRRGKWLMGISASLVLAGALWRDTADWAGRRGEAALRAGDAPAAMASLGWASRLGAEHAVLSYNLGVGFYRMGDFARAERQFTAALVSAEPGLALAARFNRGNARYRLAERQGAGGRDASGRWYGAAMADYADVLARQPEAGDARVNLAAARVRQTALMAARTEAMGKQEKSAPAAGNPSTASGKPDESRPGAKRMAGEEDQANRGRQAEAPRDAAGKGESRRDLTRTEAERLLNDARGRERLAGPLHGGGRAERQSGPEKDW